MYSFFNEVLQVLHSINQALHQLFNNQKQTNDLDQGRLLNKTEVINLLRISDSSYRRYIKKGILKPMRMGGIDMFYKRDILEALERSRIKGKL